MNYDMRAVLHCHPATVAQNLVGSHAFLFTLRLALNLNSCKKLVSKQNAIGVMTGLLNISALGVLACKT